MQKTMMQEMNIVFPAYLISIVKKFSLHLDDFILLAYFWNTGEESFDINKISNKTHLTENEVLTSFNTLMNKKLIRLDTIKDENEKSVEIVNLEYLYTILDEMFQNQKKEEEKNTIFDSFEQEFGRPISSMEYEIINAWIEKGFSEEMILGALKEAVYNGANSLRYIDTILYNWQKSGYKSMKDVNNHKFKRKENKEEKELFDYNWLDEHDE